MDQKYSNCERGDANWDSVLEQEATFYADGFTATTSAIQCIALQVMFLSSSFL